MIRSLAFLICLALAVTDPARAQGLLRDPDIEYALGKVAEPVLNAAGLGMASIDILVVDDGNFNAFVVDRNHIFINSGLIQRMRTPAMLQAVIAHEAAHITNGHLMRRPINLRNARTAAGIGSILAAAAAVAAGAGEAAGAVALGAQNTAMRLFFVHTRAEESAADQSGMRYLARAGIDPNGMLDVLDIFRGQELLVASRQDPYARTHPLSQDRYRVVARLSEAYFTTIEDDPDARYWFARAKSKLSAFRRAPKWTHTRAGEYGFADVEAMRRAVAWHRSHDMKKALAALERALAARPDDPFYHELKGQILMENRRFADAAATYERAAQIAPRNALILGAYGRALLADGQTQKALEYLETARARDARDGRVLRDLARAYAQQGKRGMASVVTAERYAMYNKMEDAALHARRASASLPQGTGGWRRAQDVLIAAERARKQKR
ncbi:MAG: M48 family metalloprotease [Pseudomonadota bacterium]